MSLEKALDTDYAPAWRPEAGDKLVGEIVGLSERPGYDETPYPIVTVRQDDGTELALHAFHTVIANELAKQRPVVGERIGVKYLGRTAIRTISCATGSRFWRKDAATALWQPSAW